MKSDAATILIVEDEAIVAADLAGKLQRLGYTVAGVATQGEQAIALACQLRPQLVLMDIWLAGSMDGIAAAEGIRRQHDVPVIYLTAHSDAATLARAKLSDPFGYILKPFEERELATHIELALYKHQADRQLRQQREWLRVTLTSIGDAVIATDASGRITFVNPVAESLTGWQAEEASGQPVPCVFRIVNEQTGQPLEDPVARVLRDGRAVELANHAALVTKVGRTVPIEDSAAPILDAAGQVIGVVLVFHDVTEKRRAETERQKFVSLADQSTEFIGMCDTSFLPFYVNEAGWRLVGLDSLEEAVRTPVKEFFFPEDQRFIYEEFFPRVLREGRAEVEIRFRHFKTGEPLWMIYNVFYIRDAQGQPVGLATVSRNITERKRAEELLRHSEERLQTISDNLPGGAIYQYVLRPDGSDLFTHVSAGLALHTGQTVGDLLQQAALSFVNIPPEDRAVMVAATAESTRTLTPFDHQFRRRLPSGELRWFHSRSNPRRLPDGSTLWDGIEMDITERKQAEEARRESERLVRLVMDLVPHHIFAKDRWGRYLFLNRAVAESMGRRPEEMVGRCELEFSSNQAHTEAFLKDDREVIASGSPKFIPEEPFTSHDGQTRFLQTTKMPFTPPGSSELAVLGVAVDITDHKRAEEALRESREDLNRAQAVAQTGSWRLNLQRNELLWSDENWRIFGVPRSMPLTYETFLNTVYPDDRAFVHEKWSAALRGEPYDVEHRIVVGDQIKWVRERAELEFDAQGTLLGGFGTTQDITAKKQAEDALAVAKAAAEAANEAKSQFLANMSHELRTPMNAILGMIDVALPKATDPTVLDCLQTARGSADLLLTLLNGLLDSAKIESGKLELESAPFSLRRMLDQIARILSVRASEKGLCFYCRMPNETPDAVVGDRTRLQQILLNLAGNAIKFTEAGDVEISVRARVQDGDVGLEFAVRDTGIGIPPASLDRVFQPFAQVDASMARRFGGTGLGLSVCRSLVQLMGGRIWVESEVGRGSTFSFTLRLPLAKELPPDLEAPAPVPAAACVPLRILLVEDNPANQKLATYILQDRGHRVDIAGDGEEAIGLTDQNRYDVILMDVQMPGMNGLEATAVIRQREREATEKGPLGAQHPRGRSGKLDLSPIPPRVPIIAMTAHAMRGDRERCLAAGMDGYLSKPIDGHKLIALVEFLAARSPSEAVAPPAHAASTPPAGTVFDPALALQRCVNNPSLFAEMIQCFSNDVDSLLPEMRAALEQGDLQEVGRLGHRLKGTLLYLGAEPAEAAAFRVERFCKSSGGTPAEAVAAVHALEHECRVLQAALSEHSLAAEPPPGGCRHLQ